MQALLPFAVLTCFGFNCTGKFVPPNDSGVHDDTGNADDTAPDDTSDTPDTDTAPPTGFDYCETLPEAEQCQCYYDLGYAAGGEAGAECDMGYPTRIPMYGAFVSQEGEDCTCWKQGASDGFWAAIYDEANGCPIPGGG